MPGEDLAPAEKVSAHFAAVPLTIRTHLLAQGSDKAERLLRSPQTIP